MKPPFVLRYYLFLLALVLCSSFAEGQVNRSRFDVTHRLPAGDRALPAGQTYSRFDIRPAATSPAPSAYTAPAAAARSNAGPIVIQSVDPDNEQTNLLIVNLLLMIFLTVIWVLYGPLYRQAMRATTNSSLMKQLYTRRSGGELTALWIGYVFFNFALGFFLYLLARRYDAALGQGIWQNWGLFTVVVAGLTGLKQWLLWVYARLFPVRKEVSYYAFIVMVFCILTGLFLVPVNLLVSYAPAAWQAIFLYGALAVLLSLYAFHLLRGGLIARDYVFQRPVHIMLYICAIEIAPLLLIYRYLNDSIALS